MAPVFSSNPPGTSAEGRLVRERKPGEREPSGEGRGCFPAPSPGRSASTYCALAGDHRFHHLVLLLQEPPKNETVGGHP